MNDAEINLLVFDLVEKYIFSKTRAMEESWQKTVIDNDLHDLCESMAVFLKASHDVGFIRGLEWGDAYRLEETE